MLFWEIFRRLRGAPGRLPGAPGQLPDGCWELPDGSRKLPENPRELPDGFWDVLGGPWVAKIVFPRNCMLRWVGATLFAAPATGWAEPVGRGKGRGLIAY